MTQRVRRFVRVPLVQVVREIIDLKNLMICLGNILFKAQFYLSSIAEDLSESPFLNPQPRVQKPGLKVMHPFHI